jgi:hypothetical protein
MNSVIIIAFFVSLFSIVGGALFLTYKKNKAEKELLRAKYEEASRDAEESAKGNEALIKSHKAKEEKLNENKEKLNDAVSGNKLDNALACDSILSK